MDDEEALRIYEQELAAESYSGVPPHGGEPDGDDFDDAPRTPEAILASRPNRQAILEMLTGEELYWEQLVSIMLQKDDRRCYGVNIRCVANEG